MQSFLVVDVVDEAAQISLRLAVGLVIVQVHLLVLQRAEEAFRLGVFPRAYTNQFAPSFAGSSLVNLPVTGS